MPFTAQLQTLQELLYLLAKVVNIFLTLYFISLLMQLVIDIQFLRKTEQELAVMLKFQEQVQALKLL